MATNYIPKIVYGSGPTTIEFDYPPRKDPFGQDLQHVGKVVESKNGTQQVLTDYIVKKNDITFSFLTDAKKTAIETFLTTHAFLGNSFTYWEDKNDALTARTVTLDTAGRRVDFKVLTRKGSGFLWELTLKFREVIA
jgi:hypothetical protein